MLTLLDHGMTYYINKHYENVLDSEIKIFINMLDFLHLWNRERWKFSLAISKYLKFSSTICTGLEIESDEDFGSVKVDLRGVDLRGVDLSRANLDEIELDNIISFRKRLEKLIKGDLQLTNLNPHTLLERNKLLKGTIFNEEQIFLLNDKYDLRGTKVIMKGGKIICFEEYQRNVMIKCEEKSYRD